MNNFINEMTRAHTPQENANSRRGSELFQKYFRRVERLRKRGLENKIRGWCQNIVRHFLCYPLGDLKRFITKVEWFFDDLQERARDFAGSFDKYRCRGGWSFCHRLANKYPATIKHVDTTHDGSVFNPFGLDFDTSEAWSKVFKTETSEDEHSEQD